MKHITFFLLIFFCFIYAKGQSLPDTTAHPPDNIASVSLLKKSILPISFIGAGALLSGSKPEKNLQTNLRDRIGNTFEFRIDDYIQYAPVAGMYIADIAGVESKNHWFDQTKYLIISNVISASITQALKKITQKERPNGSPYSFPSGHTTFAFTNATVLFNEFRETSPVLAYSGYAFSTTTGIFRMLNNKHWLSDVLAGAGIGMIVTVFVYHFEPLKNFNPFKKSKNFTFLPQLSKDHYGFYLAYSF